MTKNKSYYKCKTFFFTRFSSNFNIDKLILEEYQFNIVKHKNNNKSNTNIHTHLNKYLVEGRILFNISVYNSNYY